MGPRAGRGRCLGRSSGHRSRRSRNCPDRPPQVPQGFLMPATQIAAAVDPHTRASDPAWVPDATVAVHGVSKWFGTKVAVSDVSCSFGPGITGLLGPNGAGKTTLMRVVTGLLRPSEGRVSVFGTDPRQDPSVYRRVGFIPVDDAAYPHLSPPQLARYAAQL